MSNHPQPTGNPPLAELLNAFRAHYHHFDQEVQEAMAGSADPTVLARLGDDLDGYAALVREPQVVQVIHSGNVGRPRIEIDAEFLAWAHENRSTSGIARFLGVSRSLVQRTLLDLGLTHPQPPPITTRDDLLDPMLPISTDLLDQYTVTQLSGRHSAISDADLDYVIGQLRTHYQRAGITMLDGMLRYTGHHVPRERIRASLLRIDPVQRVFDRIRIRRRVYEVSGPNALWHHDGQHGTICSHCSRDFRSVHNVRIERLWVDVTAQVGDTWARHFEALELYHGLDCNNSHHIWLLQYLFLPTVNSALSFFAHAWNQHKIQMRNGPNRSPTDMFGFDMLVHGVRGDQLPDEPAMSTEELEVYGVDWEGLYDSAVLHAHQANNIQQEGATSWVGRIGPPEHLNELQEIEGLGRVAEPWAGQGGPWETVESSRSFHRWIAGSQVL
ncbi:hypothetical protein BD779DRAFT_1611784 [Infundibulicybe gibba]|nr:hypothetical protein BD779DRAFT_1611784 [Infundibulicybe gibba]